MHRLLYSVLMLMVSVSGALAETFEESFTTTTYRDAVTTTAEWNTAAGTIHLAPVDIAWIGGRTASGANRVMRAGDTVYLARGSAGVELIDVTNPLSPSLAGSIPYGGIPAQVVLDIELAGDILYVAWSKTISLFPLIVNYGVDVFSVANPATPVFVQTLSLLHAEGLTVHGNRLYVATGAGLSIWDITDPPFPANLGALSLGGTPQAVAVAGETAFVAAGSVGMYVVDVSNPALPALRATRSLAGAEGVDVDGALVAVATGASGVYFYDATFTNNPILLGSWNGGTAHTVRLDGDVATVADGSGGLVFLDVSDPSNALVVESDASISTVRDATASGSIVFAAHDGGLAVYRGAQTPPVTLERSETTGSTANPTALRVSGDYAFMADGVLRIFDASRTAPLDSVATWGTLGVRAVDVDGSLAYVDDNGTFTVLDVSNPAAPTALGTQVSGTAGFANDIVSHGSLVYVSYQWSGLYVFDVSNPAAPILLDTYPSSAAWDLDASGSNVYMADANVGLRIFSAANPAVISPLGTYSSTGVTSVVLSGHYAFVGGGSGGHDGLEVVDVSNPSAPVKVGGVAFVPVRMAVSGNILVVAGAKPVLIMDISDPANPATLSSYSPAGTHINYDVTTYGDMAYVAQWFSPSNGRLNELRIFDRGVRSGNNIAASTTIGTMSYPIGALRMTPTSQGSISWSYSTNGGANFYPRVADGSWENAASGATAALRWKATLNTAAGQPAPVCTHLVMEWRAAIGLITSISDVPADQGGAVRIDFLASSHELVGGIPVVSYAIYRRSVSGWDSVAVATPSGADAYSVVAPTAVDSTLWDGITYSGFKIRTWFSIPSYVDSPADSGYSVDNIAPGAPQDFSVAYQADGGNFNHLTWGPPPEPDVFRYYIYRSTDALFTPGPATRVDSTVNGSASGWKDPDYSTPGVYYKAAAVDTAGNEGPAASPEAVTSVDDVTKTGRLALHQNTPNPFNPITRISYDVPHAGATVDLSIFDVAGRRLRRLVNRTHDQGSFTAVWDGRDMTGNPVTSGVYFYRLTVNNRTLTRKAVLLK